MKNYVQMGSHLTVPAPADISSGDGIVVGSIFGIASIDALTGENVSIATEGVYSMPKVGADAFDVGETVYFDEAAGLMTETSTGNIAVGVAVEVAATSSAAVNVRLDGKFAA
ncbi:MAG: DUF2190 family protein [Pseudomonadota bacterium]